MEAVRSWFTDSSAATAIGVDEEVKEKRKAKLAMMPRSVNKRTLAFLSWTKR
jgi:hypothetical protein